MERKEFFAFRKYKVGLVSVAVAFLFLGAPAVSVAADELASAPEEVLVASRVEANQSQPVLSVTESASTEVATPTGDLKAASENSAGRSDAGDQASQPAMESPQTQKKKELPILDAGTQKNEEAPTFQTEGSSQPSAASVASSSPASSDEKEDKLSAVSNHLVHAPAVWKEGYKGQGRLIAIIDSGIDVDHDTLRISDLEAAKYKSKEEMEAAKKAAGISYGKWYNSKVVFGYNYIDGDTKLKEADTASHGMHVTGISAGNPSKPNANDELISGVAPEAQVLFMRVFSDHRKGTDTPIYVKAIEDAVKLGADSINLSLGSTTGSTVNADPMLLDAIAQARKAGVSVVMAAGNDNVFGNGHALPKAENPDYGLVGSPSTARDGISVASFNNTFYTSEAATIVTPEGQPPFIQPKTTFSAGSDIPFDPTKTYDYEYVDLGYEEDYGDRDMKGKIVLIRRGEITFNEKITRAAEHGAAGAIVFNNRQEGDSLKMSLEGLATTIPSAFFPQVVGEELARVHYQLRFDGSTITQPNPQAGAMSDFTSWGLTSDGELKPDVSAPGGAIYSSINDNQYTSMNGTSMASPQVAGVVALIKQYLLQAYPDKTAEETEALVKHLLMSSATPHFNKEAQAYTSPRQQGAGMANALGAIENGLYATGPDDYGSISLGNVGDQFRLSVTLHNISKEDKKLKVLTNLTTDQVQDGRFTLTPRALAEITSPDILVPANSSKTIDIPIDASSFHADLLKDMPNGYYLEGFVRFLDAAGSQHLASIPFVGFRGAFQNLPVAEKPIYDFGEKEEPFYHEVNEDHSISASDHVTALITGHTRLDENGGPTYAGTVVLGSQESAEGVFTLQKDATGKVKLAISPNEDGNRDSLYFKGVFFRNFENLTATVYKAEDTELSTPVWESSRPASGDKNYYDGNEKNPKSLDITRTTWEGKDQNGQALPDGSYVYVVRYYPSVPGAAPQELRFDVELDRQAPLITTAVYDEASRRFTPRASLEGNGSGIYKEEVFYMEDHVEKNEEGNEVARRQKVEIRREADGSYILPEGVSLNDLVYALTDYAGNHDQARVEDLIKIGNERGRIVLSFRDQDTKELLPVTHTILIKDKDGKVIDDLERQGKDVLLPFGDYTLDILLYDEDNVKLLSQASQTLKVDADHSYQLLDVLVRQIERNSVTIDFDQALPVESEIVLVNENGRITLPKQKYSDADYGKNVPTGTYTLEARLPQGLELVDEDLSVTVVANKPTRKHVSLLDKRGLLQTLAAVDRIEQEARYYNADQAAREGFDDAVRAARVVVSSKVSQEEINRIVAALDAASQQLKGAETKWDAFLKAVGDVDAVQASSAYVNASGQSRAAYDALVQSALLLSAKEHASQAEVDGLVADLVRAQAALDGQVSDVSGLRAQIEAAQEAKGHSLYRRASADKKLAFDQVLEAALNALNGTPSQAEVDALLARLKVAQGQLDGRSQKVRYKTETHQVKYNIIERVNPNLPVGYRKTIQHGVRGRRTDYLEITAEGRRVLSSEMTLQPIDKIIEVGGKQP